MQPFTRLTSHAVVLLRDDVDTDQIIPARFLTTTSRTGLGRHLFADWRSTPPSGAPLDLDHPAHSGARILVVGRNFGCGSSREHAAWAIADVGFRVVIARSFADIFRSNALKNGLVPVALTDEDHASLLVAIGISGEREILVDLATMTVSAGAMSWTFTLPAFARRCLLDGVDELGFLLGATPEITAFEARHPATIATTG